MFSIWILGGYHKCNVQEVSPPGWCTIVRPACSAAACPFVLMLGNLLSVAKGSSVNVVLDDVIIANMLSKNISSNHKDAVSFWFQVLLKSVVCVTNVCSEK